MRDYMAAFENIKHRHELLLAQWVGTGAKARMNIGLITEVKSFVRELGIFMKENKSALDTKKKSLLIIWREHWLGKLAESPVYAAAA